MDSKIISSRGGKKTLKRYGRSHFQEMGKRSVEVRKEKYGSEFYVELSRKGVEARRKKAEAKKNIVERVIDSITSV
jgi:uncharacterized protein